MPGSPTTSQLIISAAGILITFVGIMLSRIGKRADEVQSSVTSQFERQMQEIEYLSARLKETREEWEGRWDRQMTRCRIITTSSAQVIVGLQDRLKPGDPNKVLSEQQVLEMQEHLERDHPQETG